MRRRTSNCSAAVERFFDATSASDEHAVRVNAAVAASPAATTVRIFGFLAGVMAYTIRVFGGYPDGVAFAVLLMNLCVPLIDRYTQPPIFGMKNEP